MSESLIVDEFISYISGSKMDDFWYDVQLDILDNMIEQFTKKRLERTFTKNTIGK